MILSKLLYTTLQFFYKKRVFKIGKEKYTNCAFKCVKKNCLIIENVSYTSIQDTLNVSNKRRQEDIDNVSSTKRFIVPTNIHLTSFVD